MNRPQLYRLVRHPAAMLVWAVLVTVVVLLPWLSKPGLWEPQEMKAADAAVERSPAVGSRIGQPIPEPPPPVPFVDCAKVPSDDDGARTLSVQLASVGIRDLGNTEGDMRLLIALLGVVCALATFGIAARLGGPRAGFFATVVLLSFPLMVLQSRQLTSEIGTATGAAMIVYGLVALARPARWPWTIPDLVLSSFALVAGAVIAFLGGGAFLGLLPPLTAVALAGGCGVALLLPAGRVGHQLIVHGLGQISERRGIGRVTPYRAAARLSGRDAAIAVVSVLALIAAVLVARELFNQIYDVKLRAPGTREVFGKSVVTTQCWSDALGGIWRDNDDLRSTYDSMFEQIGFGMFPWAVLAPVALFGLALGGSNDDRRHAGRLTLAWAALAWITCVVFQRKVGFTLYAGFPACAIAIGIWLDGFLSSRDDQPPAPGGGETHGAPSPNTAGLLVGLWVLLGMITLAKDLQAFPERLTSLLVGSDSIKYPAQVKVNVLIFSDQLAINIKLRSLLLVLAGLTGLSFALGAWQWRPPGTRQRKVSRWLGRWGIHVSLVLAVLTGLFWGHTWQRRLSMSLSSKHVFSVYRELAVEGDRLGIMGDMGNSPRYYAGGPWETIAGREGLIDFLAAPERVFALAPNTELCAIHRAFSGKPYFVLDDTNARFMLLSNEVTGARDHNPLSTTILREKPDGIKTDFTEPGPERAPVEIVYDDKIQLIGYTMPRSVGTRSKFAVTLYFKVLAPVSGAWKIFAHFDGRGQRFQGDHDPINGRCATSFWQEGDYIVDTFTVEAGDITTEPGNYALRVGFFTGTNPNWKNMRVSKAPAGAKDDADRVLLGTLELD